MPALDRLVDAMTRYNAEEVVLQSGEPPCLKGPQGSRPLNGKQLSSGQILGLLAEIAPPEFKERVRSNPNLSFRYSPASAPRAVMIELARVQGALRANLRWAPYTDDAGGTNGGVATMQNGTGNGEAADVAPAPAAAQPAAQDAPGATAQTAARPAPRAGEPAINQLFDIMVEGGSSDLHLCVGSPPQLRLHGDMQCIEDWPVCENGQLERLLFEITPERNRKEFEEIHDTDFAYPFRDICRVRCNLFMDRKGIGGVFRQIPNDILSWEKLGIPKKVLDLCFLSKGLVIITGPTGSGKSTTLAALIDYINDHRTDHIITIEDPIEFVHSNKKCLINQREVGDHTGSFKRALRAALREDPDIVLVGELRDLETVAIAIETAETGHLVFATLHTNTAASTVDRIIDQFPGDRQSQIRTMLSETLKGVIAQTLCKRREGGRVAAYEILFGLPSVANLIREGKTFQIPSIIQTGRQRGMITMNQSLLDLVLDKVVDPAQAYLKSVDQADLLASFERANIKFDPDTISSL